MIVLEDGWWHTEKFGSWAVGLQAKLNIYLLKKEDRELVFECRPQSAPDDSQQEITIEVNGVSLKTIALKRKWQQYNVSVPGNLLAEQQNHFVLKFRHAYSARELGQGKDKRKLAVGFRRIGLLTAEASLDTALEEAFKYCNDKSLHWLKPGTAVIPLKLPPHRKSNLGIEALVASGSAHLAVNSINLDGEMKELIDIKLRAGNEPEAITTAVGFEQQGYQFLVLAAHFGQDAKISFKHLNIRVESVIQREPKGESNRGSRPDIVVLIPDALRSDHLGCYGYPRPTSPNIDRFAQESLVFTDAVALASYTLCSVPTIITGTSFLEHGVVNKTDRLPEAYSTLAEYLTSAGYTAIGISANAYHSSAFGSDQGYDFFANMSKYIPPQERPSYDPQKIVDLAIEKIKSHVDGKSKPYFLLLHFVPPHAPYRPYRYRNLFTDSHYSGSVVSGEFDTLGKIRSGRMKLNIADQEHLRGLYDGNIRKVDEAIGRLLDSLRSSPRWSNTAVLLISDHGEAFFEHGHQGHLVATHEEMIRVPFILHLPPDLRFQLPVNTEGLVSLADVTPTLLGLVGIKPDEVVTGRNLLQEQTSSANNQRLIICRNGGASRPTFAVRTNQFKSIVHELRVRQLFSLANDPGEHENIAQDHPYLLAGFSKVLFDSLVAKKVHKRDPAQLDDDDLKALRALGYLH